MTTTETQFQTELRTVVDEIYTMLCKKNAKYGDSALNPKRIFSKADTIEQIKVRIDDKLSRLANQASGEDEDVEMDLIGYLLIMRVAKRRLSTGQIDLVTSIDMASIIGTGGVTQNNAKDNNIALKTPF